VGRKQRSSRDLATRVGEGIAEASAAAVAFRMGWQRSAVPQDPHDRMALEHERQLRTYQRDVTRYRSRLHRLRRAVIWGTWTAVVAGGAAGLDLLSLLSTGQGLDAWFWAGAPTAIAGAAIARSSSRAADELPPPTPPTAPPPPPRPLPQGVTGSLESAHLHRVRVQLAQLMPTIAGLHEEAAVELRRADFEAAPALAALVDRLAVLHRVTVDMAGTAAAATAQQSSEEIRRRLAQGVSMYEDLLNAALQMLSAPDPRQATITRLEMTVRELTAYTEGLRVAASTHPAV
jgi:hypothetical protein